MNHNENDAWMWTSTTLLRSQKQTKKILQRSLNRNFSYQKPTLQNPVMTNNIINTSEDDEPCTLDEAFSVVMKSLSKCSRQCLNYYKHQKPQELTKEDKKFCARYLQVPEERLKLV